nr:probable calcium-binding protein CML47 [Ipomoea trifida]
MARGGRRAMTPWSEEVGGRRHHVDGLINTRVCLEEVSHLFDESEPSFEEIKETFDMFDEDGDGYIDEKDLGELLFRMGFCEFSQRDCRGMIKAFDENKDGRIDIGEFLKLMEDSFD